ncbi:MAG: serine/threonine-protein kinase, partial [Actinomycetota bacterium]|nr:serine/threonine-protein kinase [Actinomycetota bacterium]
MVGTGSQGEVRCARDVVHDRLVAIKVRRTSSAADRAELLAEARTLLDVRPHIGISLAREDFFAAGQYHLVMDWVQGIDLSRWLTERSPAIPSYIDVLRVLGQVADALDHLHGHHPPVVHKDVKPSNILIDRDGRAVLVDFGLTGLRGARHCRSGTMGYRAPEVAAGEGFGATADVLSLAATAYFAFTGGPPEPGGKPAWRFVPAALVPRVEAALARGLALGPTRRPPSARAFVELLSPPAAPHNLPASLTRFVGRESDLSAMTRSLRDARLLTLTGIGGVGKTRLSVQLAAQESWAYPDGVWFVELGPLGEGQFVAPAIAKAMGVPEAPGRPLLETVGDRLRNRRVLLVVDNCEHVLDAAAETAEFLLKAAPELRIVATSRQPLDIFGEVAYRVPPLPAPQSDEGLAADTLEAFESVVLFCDRAAVSDPSFVLEPANAR